MLSFDDTRWLELEGGYRTTTDLRPALRMLETASDPESTWDALWQELYHQGDVGLGSYVAVPHLVRIHRMRGAVDWNTYALVASINAAQGVGDNPDMPEWARRDFDAAIRELAEIGLSELGRTSDSTTVRSILAVMAMVFGVPKHGQLLLEYSDDEISDLIESTKGKGTAGGVRQDKPG